MIERVCLVDLGMPADTCSHLDLHHDEQDSVQRHTSAITAAQMVVSSVPGLVVCLFLGPWSDANGRKPLILAPLMGVVVADLYLIVSGEEILWGCFSVTVAV